MTDSSAGGSGPPPRRGNRRRFRSHLVNSDVRLRLVWDDTLFALVAALTAVGILYYFSNRQIGDSLYSAHLSIKETRELLTNGAKIAGIVTFCITLLFGFWSLIDAHRIAGPLHRLHRLLIEMGDGDLRQEIQFRRRDEFQEIAAAADRVVDQYVAHIGTLRERVQALQGALPDAGLSAEETRRLREQVAGLARDLEFFRLPADSAAGEKQDGKERLV